MLHSRPGSFRRILLLRILLLSFPILLIGQYVTVRKARSSLLETARQNLTSSAVRKAVDLSQHLRSLQSSIQTVSQTYILQAGSLSDIESFLPHYVREMPQSVDCVQLNDEATGNIVLNTCNDPLLSDSLALPWRQTTSTPAESTFYLTYAGLLDPEADPSPLQSEADQAVAGTDLSSGYAQLDTILAAPVYTPSGQLRYTLTLRSRFSQFENTEPWSLVGDTVVVNSKGVILTHPDPNQVGKLVDDLEDNRSLSKLLRWVEDDKTSATHIFDFLPQEGEWLAGFTGVNIPITPDQEELWMVLAVTPMDHALQGLEDIRDVLIVLTLGLLTAYGLLAHGVARSLSLPIEQLSQYAQQIQDLNHLKAAPRNFKVRELENLAQVLTSMIKRLDERAKELRHAWQDAQLANQLKSEFLANTSHELRTPLNAIIGCIRLVRDDCCDTLEEEREFLDRADKAAIHLLRIINDILDIAKIESGKLNLRPETVDLRQILQEVLELQSLPLQQKSLSLHQTDMPNPIWVYADRAKLKQVLLNILYNAIKFTDEGEISLSVDIQSDVSPLSTSDGQTDNGSSVAPTTSNNGHVQAATLANSTAAIPLPRVVVTITDTGIGIDPQQQTKLFRPFVMVDGSTTRRFEGTGLGLAISKNFMDLMGGSISLHSDGIGLGTTVILMLPLADKSGAASQSGMPVEGSYGSTQTDTKSLVTSGERPSQDLSS